MAKNVVINDVVYQNVPQVSIPLSGSSGTADFYDISDATLDSGDKMLQGLTAYSNGTKYTGTIQTKTASDLTASGGTVTVPSGYYGTNATKTIAAGSATVPATTIAVTPSISINTETGLVSVTASASQAITPTVTAGYVAAGTSGTVTVSGSETEQLMTKAAATYTPSTSNQTISAGQFLTGTQTILGDADLIPSNIKSGVTIFGVAGGLTAATVSQDASTKVLSIS